MTESLPILAGVAGWPVGHSLSPVLHGHWLTRHGIKGHYLALPVRPEHAREALMALPRLGFRGVNVTIPHKELALTLASRGDQAARAIGAANVLLFDADGAITAKNTDAHGFLMNLNAAAPGWASDGRAVVLGAGGAARAVVHALGAMGVPQIIIVNRSADRAQALAADFGLSFEPWQRRETAIRGAHLLVNATSLGMTGMPPLDITLESLAEGAVVADLVYRPLETPLLRAARARGLVAVDGLGMLIHQAAPAFEDFYGVRPEIGQETRALLLAAMGEA
jgi:shikimate dehydrogenase